MARVPSARQGDQRRIIRGINCPRCPGARGATATAVSSSFVEEISSRRIDDKVFRVQRVGAPRRAAGWLRDGGRRAGTEATGWNSRRTSYALQRVSHFGLLAHAPKQIYNATLE